MFVAKFFLLGSQEANGYHPNRTACSLEHDVESEFEHLLSLSREKQEKAIPPAMEHLMNKYHEKRLLEVLGQKYLDMDDKVAMLASNCLNAILKSQSNEYLRKYVADQTFHPAARRHAIQVLEERKDKNALLLLIYHLHADYHFGVRLAACEALGEMGDLSVVNALESIGIRDDLYEDAQFAIERIMARDRKNPLRHSFTPVQSNGKAVLPPLPKDGMYARK